MATKKKALKKSKLRHAEYYDFQEIQDMLKVWMARYSPNLILLCGNAHRLIHATDPNTIARLTDSLNLTPKQKTKVDKLRSLVHVESC